MKKRVLLTLGLIGLLTLGGCSDTEKKLGTLSAPQQIIVQSNDGKSLIIFDEVANAQYYNIYINDMSITVKGDGSGTVEFDASRRAKKEVDKLMLIDNTEASSVSSMLGAAAMTYVASLVSSLLNLLRLIIMLRDRED